MKKYYYLLYVFIYLATLNLYSQSNSAIKAEEKYTDFFNLPRETLFLHTNKTTYLKGEEIWFKGYAYDQKNQLTSKATTNINVGIYDTNGKEIKRALFKGKNGITKGNFLVDETFESGTYYLKASTNWMKNFNDNGAYIQKITIINNKISSDNDVKIAENMFDFQFLPEGGHIVANTKNTIGFKVTDGTGKGISATGSIYDENNEEITRFESNALGLGKFLFKPKSNKNYSAKIKLASGEVIEQKLPAIDNEGISIMMNNLFPDKTIITLNTNSETLKTINKRKYRLLIHQSGKLKTVHFTFDEGTSKTISILKKELFKGINIATLFDENEQPILERLFFNEAPLKQAAIHVNNVNTVNDSISLAISELNLNEASNLSISVLPKKTESYAPSNTIISSFHIQPYIKGTIENPSYYFNKSDRKTQYELDILLLTQGWSKYGWDEIFYNPPKQQHRFENGITLRGRVNSPNTDIDTLFLFSTKNHKAQFIKLDENQSFTLNNFFIEKDEEVRFSYQDKRGELKKPGLYVSYTITDKEDNINDMIPTLYTHKKALDANIPEDFISDDVVTLEKVVVKVVKQKPRAKIYLDADLINDRVYNSGILQYAQFNSFRNFIQNIGYRTTVDNQGRPSIVRNFRQSVLTPASPLVYLDDVLLIEPTFVLNLSMADVERVLVNRASFGVGTRGIGGVIRVYTRTTPLYNDEVVTPEISNINTAPYAFSKAKEYYSPKYHNYDSDSFKKYGAISWFPEVNLQKNSATVLTIPDTKAKYITLYIEGITEEGNLISQKKIIDLRKNY